MTNKPKSKSLFSIITVVLAAAALSACVETVDMNKAIETSQSMESDQLSNDIRLASSAMAMRMKGYGSDEINGVTFAPGSDANLSEAGTNYDGFTLSGLNVLSYATATDGSAAAELSGMLLFEDQLGRRAAARFLANYQFAGNGITITNSSVTPVYALEPETEAYIVPFNPNTDMGTITASIDGLYSHAVKNAVAPGSVVGEAEYDIFVFSMDRVSESSKQVGRISKNKKKAQGFEGATTRLDYNGWPVLIISGAFDLGSISKLYAKAIHTPGDETFFFLRGARMVGLYGVTNGANTAVLNSTKNVFATNYQ